MRAKPHQFQTVGVGLAVNQHEIGPDMTIPMIVPLPGQRVIANNVAAKAHPLPEG